MNARRYPRTMQSAFGPYTDHRLHPMPQRRPPVNRVYCVLLAVALGVSLALLAVHELSK